MAIQIFDEFLKEFEQPITAFVSNSVQNLAAAIDTPLRTAVTLWVVLYGIAILRGTIREPIMSFAWSAARVIVIVALATNASTFQTYVTGLFFESLPKEIGNAIAGAGLDTSSGVPFDRLLNKGIEVATKIYEQSGLTNIAPALIAAILMVFTAVSGFLQFAVLLYAKIGLGIVIALGPLFIAFMLFEVTRPFGVAWTRQVANFIILHVLVVALVGLMLTTVSSFVDKYGANATNGGQLIVGAVAISAILGLAAYIALQLPEIASGLAGGGATLSARTAEYVAQAYVASAAKASVAAALGSIGVAAAARRATSRGAAASPLSSG
jgi:type IV secretion system protein VirB6